VDNEPVEHNGLIES
jgi:hypothetical protein